MTRLILPALLVAVVAVALAAACDDPPAIPQCGEIPDGGCPDDYDADYCSDPTCVAVYSCTSTGWVEGQVCPVRPIEAGADVEDAAEAEASVSDVFIDAPAGAYGGPGCMDLEMPDCSVGTGLACGNMPGCCGCEDLYVCVDGGWTLWGECTDAGVVAGQ
jgi:hypothetical protein